MSISDGYFISDNNLYFILSLALRNGSTNNLVLDLKFDQKDKNAWYVDTGFNYN